MWIRTELIIVVLSLLTCNDLASSLDDLEVTEHAKLLEKLLQALQQVAKFYNREYQNVNLDSIYGVRVAEGALKSTLIDVSSGVSPQPTPKVLFSINSLHSQFSGIARKSLHYLEKTTPEYYHRFSKVVAEPWDYFKDYKRLDHSLTVPLKDKKDIDFAEELSDSCMIGLMGTANKTAEPCQISDKCWNLMSTKGYKEYVTTHQALFFILGDIQGCRKQLETRLKASAENPNNIEDMLGQFCADVYPEMLHIENTSFPREEQDLFMEQGIVCGMIGYYEYLNKQRLETVLSWKTPQGCYGFENKKEAEKRMLEDEDELVRIKQSKIHVAYPNVYSKRKLMSMDTRRKLLVETALDGGCMAHMTGVAVGLLGLYVKWMVSNIGLASGTSQATHVIKARSISSYEPPFASTKFFTMWSVVGLLLTLFIIGYIVFKKRAGRLLKRILMFTPRTVITKDMKYIA